MPADNTIRLPRSNNGDRVQMFPLIPGQVNKTSGTWTGVTSVYCVSDGQITATGTNGVADTFDLVQGDTFGFLTPVSMVVVSGKVHFE